MAETLIILPVMLLLIFSTIQFALIFHAKITLNYAAFEAVRAGSLNNAQFEAVLEGFARGLAPLYSYDPTDTDQVGAFQVARDKILDEYKDTKSKEKLVRIELLSPTELDFSVFAVNGAIPNDNLRFRTSMIDQQAHTSLQDANLLHIRVTYWYPLYVPGVNTLIKEVVCAGKWSDDKACATDTSPRIPLTATSVMRMQSPAKPSLGYYQR